MSNRRSKVKHTRLLFEPLRISTSIVCTTPASPLVQTANTILGEYEPDRALTPCVIKPIINVVDPDGIFPEGIVNHRISTQSIKWKFNGINIEDIPAFAGKYEIVTTATPEKGSLILYRNTPITENWEITFEAEFEDWRRGKIETAQSNVLNMFTSDLGEDLYGISIDKKAITYDPVKDSLYMYEWMMANNLIEGGNRENYINEHSYESELNILINAGTEELDELPPELALELHRNGTKITPGSTEAPEIESLEYPTLKLDLRMAKHKDKYDLVLKKGDRTITVESFSFTREVSQIFTCEPMFGSDISPHQNNYVNRALVNLKDQYLTYPQMFYWLRWYTQSSVLNQTTGQYSYGEEKEHGWGGLLDIPVKDIGIGVTKNDNFFAVFFDAEEHPEHKYATDENGNILTDEDGNELIMQ